MILLSMPYKDLDKKREYNREWVRRKKLGLDTKIIGKKPVFSPDERQTRERINSEKYRDKNKIEAVSYFRNICYVCHKNIENGNYHKKDGDIHPQGINYINNHKDEFIYVCSWCHRFIHVLMKLTNWDWKKIEKFIYENRHLN